MNFPGKKHSICFLFCLESKTEKKPNDTELISNATFMTKTKKKRRAH